MKFKMNKIVNKFLSAGDKFIPELHLRQSGFNYSACRPFTKHHERIQKFRKAGNLKHIYIFIYKYVYIYLYTFIYKRFKGNICAADLAEIGSFTSSNHGVKYLL